MTPSGKYSLLADEKQRLGIPKQAESYLFQWDKIRQEQCQQIDQFIEKDGFTISDRSLKPFNNELHNYSLVAFRISP